MTGAGRTTPVAVDGRPGTRQPNLPVARGTLSAYLLEHLATPPHPLKAPPAPACASWASDDLQLALYVCYELHYRSFAGVDEGWEWHPDLLRFRAELEVVFERGVRAVVAAGAPLRPRAADDVEHQLWSLASGGKGPSLSAYVAAQATLEQVRELAVHRSAYQLKEADPHTWAIPRLAGGAKAAMVEIQADEYGGGREAEMHASLFAVTMAELGLDNSYGAYLDWLPGFTLATVNLISLFGLHRRLRGALVGHLAIFEMTSVVSMGRYSAALARLGVGEAGRRFYDVHVLADAHHEHVAAHDMAGRLAVDEPALVADILFGAMAVTAVEARFTSAILDRWARNEPSLLRGIEVPSP
ncbi:MAG: iron-containing redox enzyme family protein [Actinobacteria bacterium]|nr:MAG: iron-containing redox enzyme family protein [Actinomycetota bacterium]